MMNQIPIRTASTLTDSVGKAVITAQLTNKGTYCVQAFDPVNLGLAGLVVGQNYTMTVSHP